MTKAVGTAGGTATGYVFFCCTAHGSCYALVYVCCDSDLVVLYEHMEKIRRLSEGKTAIGFEVRLIRGGPTPSRSALRYRFPVCLPT